MTKFVSGQWNAICNACMQEKSIDSFYLHSNGKPRKQCKACHSLRGSKWRAVNRDVVNYQAVLRRKDNPEPSRKAVTTWRKANLAYDAYRTKLYKTRKTERLAKWANLDKIKAFYKNCPEGFHVDHIVPLNGKLVSGLHVEENLQYLPAIENCRKGNRYVSV